MNKQDNNSIKGYGYSDFDTEKELSKITTIFKGEFVQVDMVDETIELTVENNVYSRSESLELLEELKRACAISNIANSMVGMGKIEDKTYSQQMQDALEPIEEQGNEAIKEEVVRWMTEGTSPLMPPRSDCG